MKIESLDLIQVSIDMKIGLKTYNSFMQEGLLLKEVLPFNSVDNQIKSGRTPSRYNNEYWDNGEHEFLTLQDVDTDLYVLQDTTTDRITDIAVEECRTLLQVPADSLVVSNAMTIGLAFICQRPVYVNQNVFWVQLDESKVNKKFLMWYFNLVLRPMFAQQYATKYLSKEELSRVKIPDIGKQKQDVLASKIIEIENKISQVKSKIKDERKVINEVFYRCFGLDYAELKTRSAIKRYEVHSGSKLGFDNYDMRIGYKYLSEAGEYVRSKLRELTPKTLSDFVAEPIVLGATISTDDFVENGIYEYISMATIKNWRCDPAATKFVSQDYYESNVGKRVNAGDLVLARSGEGTIGKVALITSDIKAIFADFTIRIRLHDYDPKFAYYYFRCDFIQYLIEVNKKGLGNNTNIFPNDIRLFPMLDITLEEQRSVAKEIENELSGQEVYEKQIEQYKSQIEKLLKS